MFDLLKKAYTHKQIALIKIWRFFKPIVPDELFLSVTFRIKVGYWPNLKDPRSFNEKLQWLKLHYIKTEYTNLVDKYSVKEYVSNTIGSKYIIPTLGVWNTVDEIDWDILPNQFVLKATHDSGGVIVCKDKNQLDIESSKQKLIGAGVRDYTKYNLEYPYKNVSHRFIAEKYLVDESGYELKDYKIFCYNGKPQFLFVASGRQSHDTRFDFFDLKFNHLPVLNGHPNADKMPTKPENFEEMLDVAAKLSEGIPQVRIDLYNVNGSIYFGEMTFFHWSGMHPFEPREWDYKFGENMILPEPTK